MRLTKTIVLTAVATIAGMTMSSSAGANDYNGRVEAGEFGLYYSPGSSGRVLDLMWDDWNLSNNDFPFSSVGADNNTASYRNRSSVPWYVATGPSMTGAQSCLPPGYVGDASTVYRNKISSAGTGAAPYC